MVHSKGAAALVVLYKVKLSVSRFGRNININGHYDLYLGKDFAREQKSWEVLDFSKEIKFKLKKNPILFLNISSSWVKIRLHT